MPVHHTTPEPVFNAAILDDLDRFTAGLAKLTPPGGVLPDYDAGYARAVRAFTRKLADVRTELAA